MGKLRHFFTDFFEESEEEIMDEIAEEGNNVNEANKKLKEAKEGKKGFFSESEDEVKESIKESEERIKELKGRLLEIKRKKIEGGKKEERKKGRVSKKKRKERIRKTSKFLFIFAVIAVVLILVYNGTMWGIEKYKNRPFRYVCGAGNPCTGCKVAVSGLEFDEEEEGKDYMYFTVRNKEDKVGDCSVNIIVEKDELVLSNKTYHIGEIAAGDKVVKKVAMRFPGGDADITVVPDCVWD